MMKRCVLVAGFLALAGSGWVWAETEGNGDLPRLPRSLAEDRDPEAPAESWAAVDPGLFRGESDLSLSEFSEPAARAGGEETKFSLGAAVGYLDARHSDGTWFAGVQARLHFLKYFAAEAAITFHDNRYQNGDVHVTQYPVQVSGMFYPLPDGEFRPYALGGAGWYYTRITYTGALSGISSQTDHTFGGHAGAGLEIRLGPSTSIDADLRYIWLTPSSRVVNRNDFDYWQGTAGINFFF